MNNGDVDFWEDDDGWIHYTTATHWMPLPAPPEVIEDGGKPRSSLVKEATA